MTALRFFGRTLPALVSLLAAVCGAGNASATSFEEMVCAMALQPKYEYYGAGGSKYIALGELFQDLGISEFAPAMSTRNL
jgi:hypothetical protein